MWIKSSCPTPYVHICYILIKLKRKNIPLSKQINQPTNRRVSQQVQGSMSWVGPAWWKTAKWQEVSHGRLWCLEWPEDGWTTEEPEEQSTHPKKELEI